MDELSESHDIVDAHTYAVALVEALLLDAYGNDVDKCLANLGQTRQNALDWLSAHGEEES